MSGSSRPKLQFGSGSGSGSDFAPAVPAYLIPSTSETKVDGEYNIAIGYNALLNNSNVSYNMSDGSYSLLPNSIGINNTALGDSSLRETKGKNNTSLGYKTGISNIIGNNNTFLGNSADCSGNNLNNSTAIGYKSKITGDNQIVLGNIDIIEVSIPSETATIKLGTASLTQDKINSIASKAYVDSEILKLRGNAGAVSGINSEMIKPNNIVINSIDLDSSGNFILNTNNFKDGCTIYNTSISSVIISPAVGNGFNTNINSIQIYYKNTLINSINYLNPFEIIQKNTIDSKEYITLLGSNKKFII